MRIANSPRVTHTSARDGCRDKPCDRRTLLNQRSWLCLLAQRKFIRKEQQECEEKAGSDISYERGDLVHKDDHRTEMVRKVIE